jgi:hypothetical protein
VVLLSFREDRFAPHLPWEQGILDGCVNLGMKRVAAVEFRPGYYLWLMAYPGSEVARSLRSEL